jgi:hypothetical protein
MVSDELSIFGPSNVQVQVWLQQMHCEPLLRHFCQPGLHSMTIPSSKHYCQSLILDQWPLSVGIIYQRFIFSDT